METVRHVVRSVIPKACALGLLGGGLSLVFWFLSAVFDFELISAEDVKDGRLYTVYSSALAFLVVFRNGQAYSRWWDATQSLSHLLTEWMDGCSQLIAATTNSKKDPEKVMAFNHMIVRLFSLLSCVSFKHIADCKNENYSILNIDGLDDETRDILLNLDESPAALMTVVAQWILNGIHCGMDEGIVAAPPPITSRVFHELAASLEQVHKLVVISKTSIPWPYTAMLKALLVIHIIYTAMLAVHLVDNRLFMVAVVFVSVFVLNCINLIACEIEHPFGDDVNDINLHHAQDEFNNHLRILLDSRAFHKPWCKSIEAMRNIHTIDQQLEFLQADSLGHKTTPHGTRSRTSLGEDLHVVHVDDPEPKVPEPVPSVQAPTVCPPKMPDDNQWWRELGMDMRTLLQQLVEHKSYVAVISELTDKSLHDASSLTTGPEGSAEPLPLGKQDQRTETSNGYVAQQSDSLASSFDISQRGEEGIAKQGLDMPCNRCHPPVPKQPNPFPLSRQPTL